MTLMMWLMLANTAFSLSIFTIWSKDGLLNVAVKLLVGVLVIANSIGTLHTFGYLVKLTS